MRQRVAILSLAISTLVVIAFMIPLALLLRNQAQNRALSRSETLAQAIATALIVDTARSEDGEVSLPAAQTVLEVFGAGADAVTILFAEGEQVGAAVVNTDNIDVAFSEARAFTAFTEGGAEVLVPLLSADVPDQAVDVVVRSFVPDDDLSEGVWVAWGMLAGLGVFLVIVAVVAADRLGRSVVRPVQELSQAALALGGGDLDRRVTPAGPDEIADVGVAFNFLAERLKLLLAEERESVADLSHRLRTPLTALRLQAETLSDREASAVLLDDIDRLESAVDRMIEQARKPSEEKGPEQADLGAVVRHRATFWKVLADEQNRPVDVQTSGGRLPVAMSGQDLGALIDTLMENVFSHTSPGVGYRIEARPGFSDGQVILVVEDSGAGFEHDSALERGESGGGSTGLGLDIVLRAAQRTGGGLKIGESALGGARVEVVFGGRTE
ncbi:MAG: HAMP domain-containing sensor histidine kinase [Acidimicrobiia bacterium]|nr:HAMP domain-containing sensor histidine kinase [Acidimicrobiia bacterium]